MMNNIIPGGKENIFVNSILIKFGDSKLEDKPKDNQKVEFTLKKSRTNTQTNTRVP